jgi:exopolyphosphatase/guanosine-5'-triphosphate,3'-diphosphate pyrophosphatase
MRNMNTVAAIDIGSNAIRLLISNLEKEPLDAKARKIAYLRVPVRLGEDVFSVGVIGNEKKKHLSTALKGFKHIMEAFGVKEYRACATSAMRESANGAEVVRTLRNESDIAVEIISGREEAEIIYEASGLNKALNQGENYLFVDVGGGSTEVLVHADRRKWESYSFKLGTLRILNNAVRQKDLFFFKDKLKEIYEKYPSLKIIASGGNINKAHKLLDKRGGESLNCREVKALFDTLKEMTYEERIRKFAINPYRADVIVPALEIFLTISKACQVEELIVPKVGLVDGIVHQLNKVFGQEK